MASVTETDSSGKRRRKGQLDVERMHAAVNGELHDAEDVPEPEDLHVKGEPAHYHAPAPASASAGVQP